MLSKNKYEGHFQIAVHSLIVNIGSGTDLSIKQLALKIKEIIRFTGGLQFDLSKPDGTPRKLLDVSKMDTLGWRTKTSLEEVIQINILLV